MILWAVTNTNGAPDGRYKHTGNMDGQRNDRLGKAQPLPLLLAQGANTVRNLALPRLHQRLLQQGHLQLPQQRRPTPRVTPTPRSRPSPRSRPTPPPHITPVPPPPSPRPTAWPRPTSPPHITPVPTPSSPRPTPAPATLVRSLTIAARKA